jgi:hypothetical protein
MPCSRSGVRVPRTTWCVARWQLRERRWRHGVLSTQGAACPAPWPVVAGLRFFENGGCERLEQSNNVREGALQRLTVRAANRCRRHGHSPPSRLLLHACGCGRAQHRPINPSCATRRGSPKRVAELLMATSVPKMSFEHSIYV